MKTGIQYAPGQYKHIAAWGDFQHSKGYFIRDEQERAAADRAPVDAIYKDGRGTWIRFADLSAGTISDIRATLERHRLPLEIGQ